MTSTAALPSLTVEDVAIDLLRPDPANPRRISDDELDALERSLRQFGFVQPVLARRHDGIVIGGHQRLVAARRLGLTSVPVIYLDLTPEHARLLGLALNKISGSWDDALLARLLADLQATPDLDLSLSGFGEDEVKELLRSLETRERRERPEAFDLEEALAEARRAPRTKPGDLWALGDHRLLCGDATSAADVARLLDGAAPTLLTTDPPYGVSLDGSWCDGVYNALGPAEAPYMRTAGQPEAKDATRVTTALVKELSGLRREAARRIAAAAALEELDLLEALGPALSPRLREMIARAPVEEPLRARYLLRGAGLDRSREEVVKRLKEGVDLLESSGAQEKLDEAGRVLTRARNEARGLLRLIEEYSRVPELLSALGPAPSGLRDRLKARLARFLPNTRFARAWREREEERRSLEEAFRHLAASAR